MFSVLFEVHPRTDQGHAYLGYGKMLRPELEGIDGFVETFATGASPAKGGYCRCPDGATKKHLSGGAPAPATMGYRRKAATTSSSTTTSEWVS